MILNMLTFSFMSDFSELIVGIRRGVVVNNVGLINKVNQHRAR